MWRSIVCALGILLAVSIVFADDAPDQPSADAAYAHLRAAQATATQPATISNAELATLRSELASLRTENAALKAQIAKLAAAPASTQPSSFASIGGDWEEAPGVDLTITQTDGSWKAHCSYMLPSFGEVQWEMAGSMSLDGKIQGTLHHTKAPKSYNQPQTREAQLSPDGNTISGRAQWGGGWHPFTWTRVGSPALAALKNWTPPEKNLKIGMTEAEADATMKAGSGPFVFIREDNEVSAAGKVVSWSRLDNSPRYANGGRVDSDHTHYHVCTVTFQDGKIADIQY